MTNGRVHGPKLEKVIIEELCSAAHALEPALPKAFCRKALKEAIKLGKKLPSPKDLAKAAREMFDFDRPGPLVENTIAWARRKAPATASSTTSSRGTSSISTSMAPPVALGGTSYAPVAVSHNINRRAKPRMQLRGDSIIVSHSEMLGSIMSGAPTSNITAFRCIGMRANPGLATVFPWLSATAVNYEKYRFHRLSFTIVPLVSTNFSGRIGVGFDYDSSDLAPGTRQEFYALTNHAENMPWQGACINVKCDKQFRFTGTHVAADNKLIDQGQVILMSDSVSNGGTISSAIPLFDLIVDYEVELIEPQQALFSTQLYKGAPVGGSLGANNVILGVGADPTVIVGPSIITSVQVVSGSTLNVNLPAGTYELMLSAAWSSGTASATITSSNATLRNINTSGVSFSTLVSSVQATSDTTVVYTFSGVGLQANLTVFSLTATRISAPVAQTF